MTDSDRTMLSPRPASAAIGTRLNGIYEIERLIATGGMGEVYKGRAIQTGDAVAIKMIRPELAQNEDVLALFRREAAALHNLYNEAIVRYYVFTIDPVTQAPYLAMEFVDGQPLSDRVGEGAMGFAEVDILRRRIATGLHAAHLVGITHRDVSPDNIILPGGDVARAKIIDFGIAKSSALAEGTVIGSGFAGKYNYVSPEQLGLQGGEVTPKSDIYSLGLVLAGALAGKPLDMGGSQMQVLEKRRRVPDLSAVDSRIRPLLARMLAPDPRDRPADMAEVAAWLPKGAKPAGLASAPRPMRWGMMAGICAVLLLAGGGFYAWTLMQPAGLAGGGSRPGASDPPVLTGTDTASSTPQAGSATPATQSASSTNQAPVSPPALTEPEPKPAASPAQQPAIQQPVQPPSPSQVAVNTPGEPKAGTQAPQTTLPGPTAPATPPIPVRPPAPPEPPAQTAVITPPVAKPPSSEAPVAPKTDPEPRTPVERIQRYVGSYDGGPCFVLWPTEIAERKAELEGFGSGAEPFIAFDTAFKQSQGFEAHINLRPVTAAQCPMVDFLRQLGGRVDRSADLQINSYTLKSGGVLTGSVEADPKQAVDVVLIGDDGLVYNLASYLKRDGAKASFGLKLEATGTGAKPQTVIALVSPAPLPTLSGPNPAQAADFFPNLARDIARLDGRLGLGLRYFRIE